MAQSSTPFPFVQPLQSPPSMAQGSSNQGPDLLRILNLFWQGRWIIGTCMILAVLIGGYYAFAVASAEYTATARLVMEQRQNQVVDLESVVSGVSTDTTALNTEMEYILSRTLVERVVDKLDLVSDPEFNATLRTPPAFSIGQVRDRIQAFIVGSAPEVIPTPERIRELTVDAVRNTISVSIQRNTYIFIVRSTTGNATTSAKIANEIAKAYIYNQIQKKFAGTEYAVSWLTERVSELELELDSKGDEIKQLRNETSLVNEDTLTSLNIRAKDLRERLMDAELSVDASAAKLTNARNLAASGQVPDIADLFTDPTLNTLRDRIASEGAASNAKVLFDSRVATLLDNLQSIADRARTQRDALGSSLDQFQDQIIEQTEDLYRLNQLQRELDATRILYETFLTRLKETSIQIGLQQADASILSSQKLGQQVAPRRSRIIVLSMVLGGFLGAAIILLRQFMHNSYRTTSELEQATGVPVIGGIPRVRRQQRKGILRYLHDQPTSAMAEAVRNLRTSILLSNIDHPPQVIMSTSSIPGEGKTTIAIGLAQNLSGLGKRVVLVECDIRRYTISQYFDINFEYGIFSAISGEVDIDQVVHHDETLGADIIFGKKTSVNAADIFSSEKFRLFLEELRQRYDYIVLDTPPVMAVPDARIIGQYCDAILYSVKWDSTSKYIVSGGLQQMNSAGLKPTGLILSQIDNRRMKGYGYGDYAAYTAKYHDT